MHPWLIRAKEGFFRLFRSRPKPPLTGSQEFTPEPTHDHALVIAVTEPKRVPRMRQIRFLSRILSPTERRTFFAACTIFFLSVSAGAWGLVRPYLVHIPAEGGVLREGLIGSPKLVNPLFASLNDVDRDLSALIYSGLFRLDQNLQPQPDLAESYRWIQQDKTLEVSLRQDATFHNGIPVTSDDILFTFQAIKNPAWRSPLAGSMRATKIIRVDEKTIQFQLEHASPDFLYHLTTGILPAHLWEEVPPEGATLAEANLKPIGSGPYALETFTRDARGTILAYRLKRFEKYYGIRPFITEREFHFYSDRVQAEEGLKSNQIDALAFIPWGEIAKLKNTNATSVALELPQTTIAFFNFKDSLLKEERVRRALTIAVDRQELADITGIHSRPLSGPFPFLVTTTTVPTDMDEARRTLDAAGWRLPEGESVRRFTPSGSSKSASPLASTPPLSLAIDVPDQPDLVRVADYLKRRWSLLGAQVTIRVTDADDLLRSAVSNRDYQILIWNVLLSPQQDLAAFWESGYASDRGLNLSNVADRAIDKALEGLRTATSTASVLVAQERVHAAILATYPALFVARPTYGYVVSKRVHGPASLRISRPSDRLISSLSWYIQSALSWK